MCSANHVPIGRIARIWLCEPLTLPPIDSVQALKRALMARFYLAL
ncbi:MAG: hypothetical protein Q8M16_17635 [Pirellulaceae bacterium]|nr:hypothetical protein [Pirellulaceae bacterium]